MVATVNWFVLDLKHQVMLLHVKPSTMLPVSFCTRMTYNDDDDPDVDNNSSYTDSNTYYPIYDNSQKIWVVTRSSLCVFVHVNVILNLQKRCTSISL